MFYRFPAFPESFFIESRKDFFGFMPNNSIAVFRSADLYPTSADGHHTFVQSTDLYYLSGIDQADTSLVLHKSARGLQTSILFISESSEDSIIWEGEKLSLPEAKKLSGADRVYWSKLFEQKCFECIEKSQSIFINRSIHPRAKREIKTQDERWADFVEEKFPNKKILNAYHILEALRVIKREPEINAIKKACQITNDAFVSCLKRISAGMYEYEIEAHFGYHFLKNGCSGFAYQPIVASGKDNCILHYTKNNKIIQEGDLILLDIGAKYANYCADMTRVIPANGKFNPRQKEVYQAVLRIKEKAMSLMKDDFSFQEYKNLVVESVNQELVQLGLIAEKDLVREEKNDAAYRKFFMHGISHHLGLDTHDYGNTKGSMKKGMVLTIEPGIYIAKEGFGIRLEDTHLVGDLAAVNLFVDCPILPEEIEELMTV